MLQRLEIAQHERSHKENSGKDEDQFDDGDDARAHVTLLHKVLAGVKPWLTRSPEKWVLPTGSRPTVCGLWVRGLAAVDKYVGCSLDGFASSVGFTR